jgi:hypothetical protein
MGKLWDQIREAVAAQRHVIGQHANERLRRRCIPAWQVLSGLEDGILLKERPDAKPNPAVEVRQVLADGTEVKTVWSWLRQSGVAKLVTVHFFDGLSDD